ncbi:uncharacterized protein V1510DRAFT_391379 [Dipodascopsis tothii]|uniref:uncharacterized protein n=1 Tax=Dipodascopsis tothii TaxID=44089 RepID=UPI0034CD31FF
MSSMSLRPPTETERNQEATLYIGNIDDGVTDAMIWELMIQAGPVMNVHLPKNRITMAHQGFGFVEYATEKDAEYAANVMNQTRLFGKPIRVNKAAASKTKAIEVGAELFVGNLDPLVDEKMLFEVFSRFGHLVAPPKIARDDTMGSKGYGFVSFDSFDSSDAAIEAMNGQFLMNKACTVAYAFKKDGKGERHGDQAERLLADQAKKNNYSVQAAVLASAGLPPSFGY